MLFFRKRNQNSEKILIDLINEINVSIAYHTKSIDQLAGALRSNMNTLEILHRRVMDLETVQLQRSSLGRFKI